MKKTAIASIAREKSCEYYSHPVDMSRSNYEVGFCDGYDYAAQFTPVWIDELTQEQKMELGIEIVAAMKASICNWSIEVGRIMALEDTFELTEADIVGSNEISIEHLPFHNSNIVPRERERLHKQALFAAESVISFLTNLLT